MLADEEETQEERERER